MTVTVPCATCDAPVKVAMVADPLLLLDGWGAVRIAAEVEHDLTAHRDGLRVP
jgi:hypothetical protein